MHDLILETTKIQAEKDCSYNRGGVKRDDYWIYGNASIITELYRKVLNLVSLDKSDRLTFEKAKEILPDIINYSQFLWEYLEKNEIRESSKTG